MSRDRILRNSFESLPYRRRQEELAAGEEKTRIENRMERPEGFAPSHIMEDGPLYARGPAFSLPDQGFYLR